MVDLGTLGGNSSSAGDVSTNGIVVGTASLSQETATHAFSWTPRGGMVDLGSLGGSSYAGAVGADGEVIGGSLTADYSETHAFSWTPRGGMADLGSLGGTWSYAWLLSPRRDDRGRQLPDWQHSQTRSRLSCVQLGSRRFGGDVGSPPNLVLTRED
jgi:probable HAF family extracellular repeat protein